MKGMRLPFRRGLIEQELSGLEHEEWYNQRFDGTPFFLSCIGETDSLHQPQKRGCRIEKEVCYFKKGIADWYHSVASLKEAATAVLEMIKEDAAVSKKLLKEWEPSAAAFYRTRERILNMNLEEADLERLEALFEEFNSTGYEAFWPSSLIDGFALTTDRELARRIAEQLEGRTFATVFQILTAPTCASFINRAEISLLRVGAILCQDENIKRALKREEIDTALRLLSQHPRGKKSLEEHKKAYYWTKNNYARAYVLDERHFLEEIAGFLREGKDLLKEAEEIEKAPGRNKKAKERLLASLHLDEETVALIHTSDDFTWWQDERKRATFRNIDAGSRLLGKLASLKGVAVESLYYLTPPELDDFIHDTLPFAELERRMEGSFGYWGPVAIEIVSGEKAQRYRERILAVKDIEESFVEGLPASEGKVTGRVKLVLSATQVGKVEPGDILVAVMTRPDYIVGMKKAAAIVTNEGGVTCHAAIVVRELRKPCVIATMNATRVFKDGDLVEVDAQKGIVRMIQRGDSPSTTAPSKGRSGARD